MTKKNGSKSPTNLYKIKGGRVVLNHNEIKKYLDTFIKHAKISSNGSGKNLFGRPPTITERVLIANEPVVKRPMVVRPVPISHLKKKAMDHSKLKKKNMEESHFAVKKTNPTKKTNTKTKNNKKELVLKNTIKKFLKNNITK